MTTDQLLTVAARQLPGMGRPRPTAQEHLDRFITSRVVNDSVLDSFDGRTAELWSATTERSRLRRLHGFLFLGEWLPAAASRDQSHRALARDAIAELTDLWHDRFADRAGAPPAAYHDETTAQRVMHLLAAAHRLASGRLTPSQAAIVEQDVALLLTDEFYAGLNNHGMFQDRALMLAAVACTVLPADVRQLAWDTGWRRFVEYLQSSYTPDGVLVEHSPSYHLLVTQSINSCIVLADAVVRAGFAAAPGLDGLHELIRKAERFAIHSVGPDGVFPRYSDSNQNSPLHSASLATFSSPEFLFAASAGAQGTPPADRTAVFPHAGYGVYRSAWGDPLAAFVYFTAAYNASYHKHSDELSLIFRHGGVDLIHEAGPNGYNYSDPFTQYAFSSFAHNTLIVDGEGLPRVDGNMDGTWLEDLGTDAETLQVRGTTTRYDGVRFQRDLTVSTDGPSGVTTLGVRDVITSGAPHRYLLLWHLGPQVRAEVKGTTVTLLVDDLPAALMTFASSADLAVSLAHAGERADLVGWYFPTMVDPQRSSALVVELEAADAEVGMTIRTLVAPGGTEDTPPEARAGWVRRAMRRLRR